MSEDFELTWGERSLIPEGEYNAVYVKHSTSDGSYGAKVKITFRIVSHGAFFEKEINAWYNLKATGKKVGKQGKIKLSSHSKLTYELLNALQIRHRVDRLSPVLLKGHIAVIRVRTVKTNSRQKKLPEVLQYSTVDEIVCLLTANDGIETPTLKPVPIPELIPTHDPLNN